MSETIRILILEDERSLQTVIERVLRDLNAEVDWATTADEAESLHQARQYDLVVADFQLPGEIDGLAYCERCVAVHPSTRCAMISGIGTEDFVRLSKDLRCELPFLSKPFTTAEFTTFIRAALGDKARMGDAA